MWFIYFSATSLLMPRGRASGENSGLDAQTNGQNKGPSRAQMNAKAGRAPAT